MTAEGWSRRRNMLGGVGVVVAALMALAVVAPASATAVDLGADFKIEGTCNNCVYVLEQVKRGAFYMLPEICEDIMAKTTKDAEYTTCHKVVKAFSDVRDDIRVWWHDGCFKKEPYNAMSKIWPCPSHVICSELKNNLGKPFCNKPKTDFDGATVA